ncbi:MAG: ABC transporter permease subunit [Promicromonosporaceae bacterium]|nr:ABC transporter permease subunit [Promicromonosporaceae bacterium]
MVTVTEGPVIEAVEPDLKIRPDKYQVSHAKNWGPGFIVKLVLMALINALGIFGLWVTFQRPHWVLFWCLLILLVAADVIYFTKRALPLKYLYPGLAFLLIFQLFVMGYTLYVSFTNFGDGHNGTMEHAINALLMQNTRQVPGTASYRVAVVEQGTDLGLAVVMTEGSLCEGGVPGDVCVGTADEVLHAVPGAVADGITPIEIPGWTILSRAEIRPIQDEVLALRVPVSTDPNEGAIGTNDGLNAFVFRSVLEYDAATQTMTNVDTGVVYYASPEGQFVSADGEALGTGWRVLVGLQNYTAIFGDARVATPFLRVLIWTICFAFLSVVSTFLLGLFLAIVFNDERLKAKKIYRTLMIFPYAIPGFLSAIIWSGLLNRSFGFVNQVLLRGASIGWLTDPWLARLSVLGVNLWLGFPYMFLICTGALQSLPSDALESAKVDGATAWRTFRSIKLPLLLVSTAPLLISSFAFNFNNFTLIYMLTRGGPRFPDVRIPVGATDILISMVYQISGLSGAAGARDFGLASALSIIVFVIVGTVSAIGFRQTKKLEEIM